MLWVVEVRHGPAARTRPRWDPGLEELTGA